MTLVARRPVHASLRCSKSQPPSPPLALLTGHPLQGAVARRIAFTYSPQTSVGPYHSRAGEKPDLSHFDLGRRDGFCSQLTPAVLEHLAGSRLIATQSIGRYSLPVVFFAHFCHRTHDRVLVDGVLVVLP